MAKNIDYEGILAKYKKANKIARQRVLIKNGITLEELFKFCQSKSGQPIINKKGKIIIHDVDIVDNSASMSGSKHVSAINGVNQSIRSLKKDISVNYTKTVVDFMVGDKPNIVMWKLPIDKVGKYHSRANTNTPLFQAIGETLERLEKEQKPGEKVLVKIFTDGNENASQHPWQNEGFYDVYKNERLKSIIKRLEDKGFTITFVGTINDVQKMIKAFDLREDNTLTHDNTAEGIGETFKMSMIATQNYSMRARKGEDVTRGFYKKVGKL